MPHFVIDCSENVLLLRSPEEIIHAVYETAESTGLFAKSGAGGIKVRINPYKYFITVNAKDDFLHIFAYIMEGRNIEQKKKLSEKIVARLKAMFPDVPIISMNVSEFEKATYCNRSMI